MVEKNSDSFLGLVESCKQLISCTLNSMKFSVFSDFGLTDSVP